MFKRKIEKELYQWKESLKIKKTAFLLKGLRQIGKTFIINKFAKDNYENIVYINFKTESSMKDAFSGNLSANDIVSNISAMKPGAILSAGNTVLIFDEIQECSGARACIKPLMEDGRFDVIASGSLLGIKGYNASYHGGVSVGYEYTVYMKSMDFEEFLWAKGVSDDVLNYLKESYNNKTKVRDVIHNQMLNYFKEYICVGGMPSVLNTFLSTHDYNLTRKEQRNILESYADDFGKHLNQNEEEVTDKSLLSKINKVFNSIPSQLAKENKKFTYAQLGKKCTSEMYDPAIQWLVDYGLINYCYNLSTLESPLEGNKIDNIFKLYATDTGLFVAMLDDDAVSEIIFGDMGIYKGAIYENIIADGFSKLNRKLYYFSKSSGLEIEFITRHNSQITLVEVKAKSGNAKSSKQVISDKKQYPHVNSLIKFGEYNIGFNENITTYPYYLIYLFEN